ncbi:MAG TPA: hypothetical protein VFX30_00430 [bacterium]|nr:hypothetical protein [bacterium]
MKSPLYLLAVAAVSAPLFMGQAAVEGAFQKGGGGFGCSNNDAAVATNQNSVDGVTPVTPENTDTVTTESDSCPAAPDPLNPSADDSCQDRDFYASVKGNDWSEEITSFFGRPVDDACAAECGGTGDHAPWTLSVKLSGTPFADGKSYSFSFMKDEWKSKVRYLEFARDASDPDGCPAEKAEPCWKTCDGQCHSLEEVVKDEDTLEKEAKALLVAYANDVCKIGLKVEDLDGDDDVVTEKIRAAAENAKFKDILYCTEGLLLTGTQVLDWVDTASSLGLIKDETGKDYTQDQLFACVKKSLFKDASRPTPSPPPPPPAAAP